MIYVLATDTSYLAGISDREKIRNFCSNTKRVYKKGCFICLIIDFILIRPKTDENGDQFLKRKEERRGDVINRTFCF